MGSRMSSKTVHNPTVVFGRVDVLSDRIRGARRSLRTSTLHVARPPVYPNPMNNFQRPHTHRRFRSAAILLAVGLLISGCRHYEILRGSALGVQSIGIGTIDNLSPEPRLGVFLRDKLAEQVVLDGSLQLLSAENAASVVTATIKSIATHNIGETLIESPDEDRRKYRTIIFGVAVVIEFSVIAPDGKTVLVPKATVTGRSEYSELVDAEIVKLDALERAIYGACADIVDLINYR